MQFVITKQTDTKSPKNIGKSINKDKEQIRAGQQKKNYFINSSILTE